MEYRDYYKTLGVPRNASAADVKKAFRRLARKHHPDVNKSDAGAEARFKEVNEAYAVLGDQEKRKAYDSLGANWEAYQRAGAGSGSPGASPFTGFGFAQPGTAGAPGGIRFEYHGNAEDLAGFSDFFRTFFAPGGASAGGASAGGRATGGTRRRTTTRPTAAEIELEELLRNSTGAGFASPPGFGRRPTEGSRPDDELFDANGRGGRGRTRQHLEADAEVTLEEVFEGTERLVQIGERRLQVKIPRGAESGQRIRLTGKAGTGPDSGHVYITVKVLPHPVFTRTGADLTREVPLTLGEALLGAEVPVETLTGRVLLRVPPETQTGRTFRLTHQGLPKFRSDERGDLFVKARVVLPTGLDEDARNLVQQLAERVHQPDPRAPRTGARPR